MENEEKNKESNDVNISKEFLEEISKDTAINDLNLKEECRNAPNKTQKYIEEYYKQKRKLKKIEIYLDKIEGQLYQYYMTEFEIKLSSSKDIHTILKRDEKYIKAKTAYNEQYVLVEFLENTIKNMNNRQWILQSMVKLEATM